MHFSFYSDPLEVFRRASRNNHKGEIGTLKPRWRDCAYDS
jgi:hypothetical protein